MSAGGPRTQGRGGPVVVVLSPGPARPELETLLGPDRERALRGLLGERALSWAQTAFGTDAVVEDGAGGSSAERSVVSRALARAVPGRPLVIVAPELVAWPPGTRPDLLGDLADGCAVSIGARFEGGFYLVAVAADWARRLDLEEIDWNGPNAAASLMHAAAAAGFRVGVLQMERGLRTAGDVRARLADPLSDRELVDLLR